MPDKNNPIIGDNNVSIDIDHLNISTSRALIITHNKGATEILKISENGNLDFFEKYSIYMGRLGDGVSHGWAQNYGFINSGYDNNDDNALVLNALGHNGTDTYYRDTIISDGKNGTVVYVDGSLGNVGIGGIPSADLHIMRSTDNTGVFIESYSDTLTHEPLLDFAKSHTNTLLSEVETLDTENLGRISFWGVNTQSAFSEAARIYTIQNGDAQVNGVPGVLKLETSSNGVANSNQLVLLNDGNIGVGVEPSYKLHIYGSAINTSFYVQSDNDMQANVYIGNAGQCAIYRPANTNNLKFLVGGSDVLYLLSDGNVGIGVTPNQPLHVIGAANINAWIKIQSTGDANADKAGIIYNSDGTDKWYVGNSKSFSHAFSIEDAAGERMRIQYSTGDISISGDVVIGKDVGTDPSYKLEVEDTDVSYVAGFKNNGTVSDTYAGIKIQCSYSSAVGAYFLSCFNAEGGEIGGLYSNGGTIEIYNTCDSAVKTDITPSRPMLDKICQIPVSEYKRINNDTLEIGVVAQDMEVIFPELTREKNGIKMISTTAIIPRLLKAIQELKAEIDLLKAV